MMADFSFPADEASRRAAELALRTTQRAPRSCRPCSTRKVRCDKSVPCSTCIRRGEVEHCIRETVIVRGQVTKARDLCHQATYEDLVSENAELKRLLGQKTGQESPPPASAPLAPAIDNRIGEAARLALDQAHVVDEMLFHLVDQHSLRSEMSWSAIVLPDMQCSIGLVQYDKIWNSWVHCAVEYPRFEQEHDNFLQSLQRGTLLCDCDVSWLALYFSIIAAALLTMDDEEADQIGLYKLHLKYPELLRNWYETALFCLRQADFLRHPDMRSVQTIAVLGICFTNLGDQHLYESMWACAMSLGQRLGLDRPGVSAADGMSQEARRRLWWTFVICDWMQMRYRIPIVRDGDFDVDLPSVQGDDANVIDSAHYHCFMSRSARVWHRFRTQCQHAGRPGVLPSVGLDEIVRQTDDELAEIINTLPAYLQPDWRPSDTDDGWNDTAHPWVVWQRFDITMVLLNLRLHTNRVLLQDAWMEVSPGPDSRVRSLCINTARSMLYICHNWNQPATKRRQWALSFHIFSSSMHLLRELEKCPPSKEEREAWRQDIYKGLVYLEAIQSHNAMAKESAAILRKHM